MATTVRLDGGKYEIAFEDDGRFYAKRYGQEWRDLTGDKMVLALVQECDSLREQRAALLAVCKELLATANLFRCEVRAAIRAAEGEG